MFDNGRWTGLLSRESVAILVAFVFFVLAVIANG